MRNLGSTISTGYNQSLEFRASKCVAQGALTNSKRPSSFVRGVYPTHLRAGSGAYVFCGETGKRYIDFICGLGSNFFGYGNLHIGKVITSAYATGANLSLGSTIEIDAAEMVKVRFPWVSRVKFLKTGSEACLAAIRIARVATGREEVLSEGYHGWHDPFVSIVEPGAGVFKPQGVQKFSGLDQITAQTAAVILEPVITDFSPARVEFLSSLRKKCSEVGAMLIFDEVITGYRWPQLSVSKWSGITPDLICLGKAIGGGLALSAVGGVDAHAMDDTRYFVSSTFAGDRLALSAFIEVNKLLKTSEYDLEDLWMRSQLFIDELNKVAAGVVTFEGYPTRGVLSGDPLSKALFMQECCKAGLLFGASYFIGFQHRELMHEVTSIVKNVCLKIKMGHVALEGELPESPFAQKMREKSNG